MSGLRISEIFYSLQGESTTVGLPTTFVRLTGCPLRCSWCDTEYAFAGGEMMSLDEILSKVEEMRAQHITVTGGEPLAQPGCKKLLTALCDAGYEVGLETSGSLSIENIDPRVRIVMDLKAPGSAELERNRWENLALLKRSDEVKLVLADRADYQWAKMQIDQHQLDDKVDTILLSPVWGSLEPTDLANWVVEDKLPVRVQLQMHKLFWGDKPGV